MQCAALCKNGHRCRGYGTLCNGVRPAVAICHIHRDFFKTDAAYKLVREMASIFQTLRERRWIIEMVRCPLFQWSDKYKEDLEREAVSNDPYERARAMYLYEIFIRAGRVSPLSIKKLWRRRVLNQVKVVLCCVSHPRADTRFYERIVIRTLKPFFEGISFLYGCTVLLCMMWDEALNRDSRDEDVQKYSYPLWTSLADVLFPLMDTSVLIGFSIADIQKHLDGIHREHPESQWYSAGIRNYILQVITSLAKEKRAEVRNRIGGLKEELVRKALHPSRVQKYLEMGYEVDEL